MTITIPDPYGKGRWRGGTCDRIDKVCFQVLEDKLQETATIFQLGYNPGGVAASSHTHDGGGAYDYWFPGLDSRTQERASRNVGIDAWKRDPPFPLHVHGIRHGSPTAHPEAKQQMANYSPGGGDGLWPLVVGDDPNPYRPDPIPTFGVAEYRAELQRRAREDRLRDKLRRLGRDIKHLTRRKRKVRRQLKQLHKH